MIMLRLLQEINVSDDVDRQVWNLKETHIAYEP